jgi:hypothetical protein
VANNGTQTHNDPSAVSGSRLGSIVAWFKVKFGKAQSQTGGQLVDDDPKPARFGMSWPDEPPLHIDEETKREFAVLDDLADRGADELPSGRPVYLREPDAGDRK